MARTVIDAHTHIYRTEAIGHQAMSSLNPNIKWNGTPVELRRWMTECFIVRAVGLVVTPTREMREKALAALPPGLTGEQRRAREAAIGAEMVQRMERNNRWGSTEAGVGTPEILPFINLDPVLIDAATLRAEIKEKAALGAKGIKLLPLQHQIHGNDRRLWPVYETAVELGLPVLSQSGAGGAASPATGDPYGRPRYFDEVARAFPDVRIILAHLGSGFENDVVALTAAHANIYADTSTVPAKVLDGRLDREGMAKLVRAIGIDHVLFGTNWPLYDPASDIAVIESLPLTESEKQAILFDNAAKVLNTTS